MAGDMSGILFFIFASCEPLSVSIHCHVYSHAFANILQPGVQFQVSKHVSSGAYLDPCQNSSAKCNVQMEVEMYEVAHIGIFIHIPHNHSFVVNMYAVAHVEPLLRFRSQVCMQWRILEPLLTFHFKSHCFIFLFLQTVNHIITECPPLSSTKWSPWLDCC